MRVSKLLFILCLLPSLAFGGSDDYYQTDSGATGITCDTLKQQEATGSGSGYNVARTDAADWVSTEFVATSAYTLCSIKVSLIGVGSPAYNLTAHIYSDSGADLPLTSLDSSSPVASSGVGTGGYALYEFTGLSVSISNTVKYHIVITADSYDADNYVRWQYGTAGTTEIMNESADGSSWALWNNTRTGIYEIYGN